jgi:DNA-binding NarL/FixJ family response regulator
MEEKIRLIHIDDHLIFLQGLRSMLAENPKIAYLGNAGTLADGLKLFRSINPDLVLLDYFLPDGKGLSLAQEFLSINPDIKIVMLTMEDHPDLMEICRSFGVLGFLSKTVDKQELFRAIDEVMQGKPFFPESQITGLTSAGTGAEEKLALLSIREKQIAYLITEGYTSAEISQKLFLSQFTVNTHRRNVLQKLGLSNTAQLAALMAKYNG